MKHLLAISLYVLSSYSNADIVVDRPNESKGVAVLTLYSRSQANGKDNQYDYTAADKNGQMRIHLKILNRTAWLAGRNELHVFDRSGVEIGNSLMSDKDLIVVAEAIATLPMSSTNTNCPIKVTYEFGAIPENDKSVRIKKIEYTCDRYTQIQPSSRVG